MIPDFFLSETMRSPNIFQVLKEKNCQPRILYSVKIFSRKEEEIKTSSDEQKLREFYTSKLIQKE